MKKIIVIILIVMLLASGIYSSYLLYNEVEKQSISYQYQQQEIYANQAVLSIENFFEKIERSLDFLSKQIGGTNFSQNKKLSLKNYFEAHSEELKAITRVSADGKIIHTFPYVESVIGKDISDQPHNTEIIKTHKIVISDVFLAVQGYRAIAYAYPIIDEAGYQGSISLVIPFNYIANKFLKDIKIGNTGASFVLSQAGVELFCPIEGHIGTHISENVAGFEQLENMVDRMLKKENGRSEYLYRETDSENLVKKIAVFRPVDLGSTFWSIAVIMNEHEILEANRGFIVKFLFLLSLVSILSMLFLFFLSQERKKTRNILLQKERKYKTDLEKLVNVRTEELRSLNESLQNDIVARKQIEQKLKEAIDKVEKSEKIKSEFLAQMSHEIRTPINTILSFSSLIREELAQHADEELSYGFSGIQSAGKRLIRTIDLILNMSDVQLGTQEYIPKKIDVWNDIVNNLVVEYRVQVKEKNIKLDKICKTSNTIIVADSYTVNQIIANLLDNAIKYTLEGSVVVECNRNSSDEFILSVIDTGLGISKKYIPNLFDEFSQEDQGYTRKFEGNGLGLALVKKYCDLNNAVISVESEKGKGSKFTVTFLKI